MGDPVEDYIAAFPQEVQKILQKVRKTLHKAVPDSGEKISYGIPAITRDGRNVVYFAGWKHHISVYPLPEELDEELAPYVKGRGTARFTLDQPIPYDLIGRVGKALRQERER